MSEQACALCGEVGCDCAEKNLDEDFLVEDKDGEGDDSKELEAEGDDDKKSEPVVDDTKEDEPEPNWMKLAAKEGWVPDEVRAKHAREAQTLRQQVKNLQTIINAAQRQEQEDYDPDEGVTRGELDQVVGNIQDRAIMSERLIRFEHEDYDEVVKEHLVPLCDKQPWIEEYLYNKNNPAKEAYRLACALRDGKPIRANMGQDGFVLEIDDGEAQPQRKDKTRPPVKALEQAAKQPKTIDSVPAAKPSEAGSMSVEDFWNLPADTLMRLRQKNPELYEEMQEKFHEKYPA